MVSLLGALFVVGTLSGTEFLVKMEEFRGVKLMHVLPIALVAFTVVRPVGEFLRREVRCAGWWPRGSWAFWG